MSYLYNYYTYFVWYIVKSSVNVNMWYIYVKKLKKRNFLTKKKEEKFYVKIINFFLLNLLKLRNIFIHTNITYMNWQLI
jgi:hypothetical protein